LKSHFSGKLLFDDTVPFVPANADAAVAPAANEPKKSIPQSHRSSEAWLELEREKLALKQKALMMTAEARQNRMEQQKAKAREKELREARKSNATVPEPNVLEKLSFKHQDSKLEEMIKNKTLKPAITSAKSTDGGDSATDGSSNFNEDAVFTVVDVLTKSRCVEPWENVKSWLITIPQGCIPKDWHNSNGRVCKKLACEGLRTALANCNNQLDVRHEISMEKLTIVTCEELALSMKELLVHDFETLVDVSKTHLQFGCKYEGRACRTSHTWIKLLPDFGIEKVDVRTLEPVLLMSHQFGIIFSISESIIALNTETVSAFQIFRLTAPKNMRMVRRV